MIIHCCECDKEVDARLTSGQEVYPHRKDLHSLPFWKCDTCLNYVGCHHKTKERTKPLGVIPNNEIRQLRRKIHAVLDPLWQSGKIPRQKLYAELSRALGFEYHTAALKTTLECNKVLDLIASISTSTKH